MNKLLIFLPRGIVFFLLFLSLSFFVLAASANYGAGTYNSGLYGKADPSSDSSTTSSSSSSSSGGGGATSQTVSIPSAAQLWTSVVAGQTLSMNINKQDMGMKKIEFDINTDLKNVEVSVNKLSEEPKTDEKISTNAYQFFEIKIKNIAEDNIGTVTLNFEVTKSWIGANKAKPEDVILLHYKDSKWEELPTVLINDPKLENKSIRLDLSLNSVIFTLLTPDNSLITLTARSLSPV